MPTDYLPKSTAALAIWFNNFASKFSQDAAGLGFLPPDVTAVNNDLAMFNNMVNSIEAYQTASKERTAYLRVIYNGRPGVVAPAAPQTPNTPPPAVVVLPGIQARIRLLVNRIKLSPAYSESTGRDFRIIAPGETVPGDGANTKPVLTGQFAGGRVVLKFTKYANDGVTIQTLIAPATDWTYLDKVVTSPGYDPRPPSLTTTVRRYRAMYFKRGADVGQWSDPITVVVPV